MTQASNVATALIMKAPFRASTQSIKWKLKAPPSKILKTSHCKAGLEIMRILNLLMAKVEDFLILRMISVSTLSLRYFRGQSLKA
jgi:hypothetical protein